MSNYTYSVYITSLFKDCIIALIKFSVLNHLPTSDEQRLKIVWKHLYGLVETHQADTTHEELIDSRLSSVCDILLFCIHFL